MRVELDDVFASDVVTAEAEARGMLDRLRALANLRESDGLGATEAVLDAAESLGLRSELGAQFESAVAPLAALEIESVRLADVHGDMPTLRREGTHADVTLPVEPAASLVDLLSRIVDRAVQEPDKTAVVWLTGLGGTGGCACGDDLPEDAPAGPLFERR